MLAIVVQAIGLLSFIGLVVLIAGFAESGHNGYEYMTLPIWLLLSGAFIVGAVATIGAVRTLSSNDDA